MISQAIIPDKTTDETKLADALGKMVRDDPTLKCRTDPETNQLIISGMGELHLEVSLEKLQRNPGVKVTVGKPMVAYRQTLAKAVEIETRYIKQSGGRGKFAVIDMKFEPLTKEQIEEWTTYQEEQGEKKDPNNIYFMRQDRRRRGADRVHPVGRSTASATATRQGRQVRLPVRGHASTLLDGKYHDVDSSQDAFKLAAMECFRDAQIKAGIMLLEPIMNVVVLRAGAVPGRPDPRRQPAARRNPEPAARTRAAARLHAYVPLAELFGYTSELRNFTSGTASFSMEPSHYAPVKEELADLREAS